MSAIYHMFKNNRKFILWLLVVGWVILFHTTGIKPAVYGEFGPTAWVSTQYVDYTAAWVDQALAAEQDVVIYFGANRCPTCTWFEKRLTQVLDQIPPSIKIFAADVDRDTAAKQLYGVRSQSTTVYLWDDGEVLTKKVARDHTLEHILTTLQDLNNS